MNRRSLVLGAATLFIGNTALRAREVQLPELTVTGPAIRPMPNFGPNVKDRRFLKDLWRNVKDYKQAKGYDTSNAEIKAEVNRYLDAIDAKFPVTFIGWDKDSSGEERLIEVTLHGFRETRNPVGCTDLEVTVSIPSLNKRSRAFTNLLNIECRRT